MPRKPKSMYDHHWRKLRLIILERDRRRCYVEGCDRPATTVDHVQPVSEAPHLRLDPSNCRASCTKHNYGRANARAAALLRADRTPGTRRKW